MNSLKTINIDPIPTGPEISFRDHICVLGFVTVSFFIHCFFVFKGFGEIDAVRLAVYAFEWSQFEKPAYFTYTFRTSILYLYSLKTAITLGFPIAHLDSLMNWTNLVFASFSYVPIYYFWRRFSCTGTCCLYLCCLFFVPAFWLGHLYGMPHIIGLFFFLISLLMFDFYITCQNKKRTLFWLVSCISASLTIGFKADLVLCFGAFMGLTVLRKQYTIMPLITTILIPALSIIFVLVCQTILFPELSNHFDFAKQWDSRFPFTIKALVDLKNIASSISTLGVVLSLFAVFLCIYGLARKQYIRFLFFIICWALPLAAFWGLKMGNSSRHMLVPMIPVLFYSVLMLKEVIPRYRYRATVLIIIIVCNYYFSPQQLLPRTVRPSSRIFEAHAYIQKNINRWHSLGRQFAADPARHKLIIGTDYIYYPIWEVMKEHPDLFYDKKSQVYRYSTNGGTYSVKKFHCEEINPIKLRQQYPDWQTWVWISYSDNTKFEIELINAAD